MLIGFSVSVEPVLLFRVKELQMKSGQPSLRSCLPCFQLPLEYHFPFPSMGKGKWYPFLLRTFLLWVRLFWQ